MDPNVTDALKLLGGGSLALALLGLIYLVGMRMVGAIAALVAVIQEHTKTDLAHHANVQADIRGLHGKIDGLMDAAERLTPVEGVPFQHPLYPRKGTKG